MQNKSIEKGVINFPLGVIEGSAAISISGQVSLRGSNFTETTAVTLNDDIGKAPLGHVLRD
jgi:hypothetical protein